MLCKDTLDSSWFVISVALLLAACSSSGQASPSKNDAPETQAGRTGSGGTGSDSGGSTSANTSGSSNSGNVCVGKSDDRLNCGKCGNECGAVALISDQVYPYDLRVDADNVYWTTQSAALGEEGLVMQMPLAGGEPIVLASGQTPGSLAIDAEHVYWTNTTDDGSVMSVPIGGGTVTTLAAHQPGPVSIAVDATNVYWTTLTGGACADDAEICYPGGNVMKVSIAGGDPVTLASDQAHPSAVAVDATSVYWTNEANNIFEGAIMKIAIEGGTPVTLASQQEGVGDSIVVDATDVYWTGNSGGHAVSKVSIDGGPVTAVSSGPNNGFALALGANSLYWGEHTSGGDVLMELALAAGTTRRLLPSRISAADIAIHGTDLYWTDQGPRGSIMQLGATSCTNGTCACPDDQVACVGVCSDLTNDAANCGQCGTTCADGEQCHDGACRP